jgi:arylsulfatase A-like enzyme
MPKGKPNILILWGDDIGIWNISHFSRGMMGYRTGMNSSRPCTALTNSSAISIT